jgi:hypothetical protein
VSNFYHNIFYYYRGPKDSDRNRERQLEDNTTKALINTLQHGGKEARIAFLKWIGIDNPKNIRFELQKKTIGKGVIARKSKRILLALIPTKSKITKLNETDNKDSRPDAWIYGDDFVVLIESKVVGYLDSNQIRYHFQKLKFNEDNLPIFEERTWADVYCMFSEFSSNIVGKNNWLINQFKQYLEFCNMTEFTGFEKEIFDFFFIHDGEETKQWVRETVKSFAEIILLNLNKFESFYEDYDVGSLRLKEMQIDEEENHCWAAFGPKEKKYGQFAHQTIIINSQGIEILVNVELKSAVDKLKKKVLKEKKIFIRNIKSLNLENPLCIQLQERKQKQASIYSYHQILKIEADYLKDEELGKYAFEYLVKMLKKVPLPYFTIKTHISRRSVLGMKDQKKLLVDKVINIMKEFHPIIDYINK